MTGPVNSPHLTDETLEAWITAAAFEYDVPEDGADRVLAAAGESAQSMAPLTAGVRRLHSVRVPHPRLVAASVLVLASLGAASLWGGHGTGSTAATGAGATAYGPAQAAEGGSAVKGLAANPSGQQDRSLLTAGSDSSGAGSASKSSSSGSGVQLQSDAINRAATPGHFSVTTPAPTGLSDPSREYGTASGGSTRSAPAAAADSAKIVHTGALTLTVAKGQVSATLTKLDDLAAGVQGYVSSTKTSESGKTPSGTTVLRVPADSYDSVLAQARKLGTVDTQTSSGVDVTAQTADLNARMKSLKKVRENYLALLAKAKTIGETLSVQQHVDDNQAQIDQLQGQINVLADQASYGTLTVTVTQKAPPTPLAKPTHHKSGIAIAWDRAVNGFVTGVEALIARSGRALLVLILLVAGAIVLRMGWRVGRRRLV